MPKKKISGFEISNRKYSNGRKPNKKIPESRKTEL